jgi:hypothetical protein
MNEKRITFCIKISSGSESYVNRSLQDYSRDISDENFVICNPKYKKPLELDFCLIRNKLAIQVGWRIRLIMTLSLY